MNEQQMSLLDFLDTEDTEVSEVTESKSNIELHNGDCLEYFSNITSDTVDLVLIDPPYEFNNGAGGGHSEMIEETITQNTLHSIKKQSLVEKKKD